MANERLHLSPAELNSLSKAFSGFNEKTIRRGKAYFDYGNVKKLIVQRLDSGLTVIAKVKGTSTYTVSCEYESSDDGWIASCSCPVGYECKHIVAVLLSIQAAATRGDDAQPVVIGMSPPETASGNAFETRIQAALGRPLSKSELNFARLFTRLWHNGRMNPNVLDWYKFEKFATLEGEFCRWNDIGVFNQCVRTVTREYPASPLELWQCVAFAFERIKVPIPDFMIPVTDTSGIGEKMRRIERAREIETWKANFTHMEKSFEAVAAASVSLSKSNAPTPLHDVRVTFDGQQIGWLFQSAPGACWELAKPKHLKEWFARLGAGDESIPPAFAKLIHAYIAAHASGSSYLNMSLSFNAHSIYGSECQRFLHHLLTSPSLRGLLADRSGRPVDATPVDLQWRLAPDPEKPGYARASLHTPSGRLAPRATQLTHLGDTLYYDARAATSYRLPPRLEGTPDMTTASIPLEALHNADALRVLSRLRATVENLDLPALQTLPFHPVLRCSCPQPPDGKTLCGIFNVKLHARTADGASARAYSTEGWSPLQLPEGSPLCEADMSPCAPAIQHLRAFKLKPPCSAYSYTNDAGAWERTISKAFPDEFAAWADTARELGIALECDPLLAGFLANPEKMRVEIHLDDTDSGIDWFDLRLTLTPEDTTLTPDEIQLLLHARGRFVYLPGKGYRRAAVELTAQQSQHLEDLGLDPAALTPAHRQRVHTLQVATDHILGLLPEQHARRLRDRSDALHALPPPPLPGNLLATLRPYQAEGYHFLAHLAANGLGGILADDMGLGKTVQTLAWLLHLTQTIPAPRVLIICPKSVVPNWHNETARFAPALTPALTIHNYAQLRLNAPRLKKTRWDAVILDEGQNIKNPASLTAKAARDLPSAHRLILTGTPVENSTLDLWSLFAFAMPGLLGTQAAFKRTCDGRKDPHALTRLARRVTPFMLRRTKAQVATELPPRIEEDLPVELEPAQQKLYDAELKRARQMLLDITDARDFDAQRFNILTSLLRLRQICCHPALLGEKFDATPAAKTEALLEQLEPILAAGHKCLVFSQFATLLGILSKTLTDRGIGHLTLTGKTENRQTLVDRFQAPSTEPVFLLSLKAAGTGLNLTAASYVILLDPWWNPAAEAQAIDRTHRIGQTSQVVAYRLIAQNTVEEKIRRLQQEKAALASAIVREENLATVLNLDDLRNILQ